MLKIEELSKKHNRECFDCGNHDLNQYLKNIGIIGFFVDAKHEDAKKYYEQFGFMTMPDNELKLFLPLTKLQQAYKSIYKR